MTSTWKGSYFALTLCLALPTVAYKWTPCSLEAWILNLQTCQQTCYGETFYNDFYNSTVCGDYDAMVNSTKKSDVDCLCENQIAGISTQTNITNCTLAACSSSYNQTLYIEAEEAYTRMCSWSFGDGTCNSTTSSAASRILQPVTFLTTLTMVMSILSY